MGFHDLVTESEAATTAGVSARTLSRFVEAGYLQIETDSDGLKMFSKSELEKLFGHGMFSANEGQSEKALSETVESEVAESAAPVEIAPAAMTLEEAPSIAPAESSESFLQSAIDIDTSSSGSLSRPSQNSYWDEASPSLTESVWKGTENLASPTPSLESSPISSAPAQEPPVTSQQDIDGITAAQRAEGIALHEAEQKRLHQVIDLQEKLLDNADRQVSELRKECDWLRARVERLEEKGERDQVLLLAQSQTVRRILVMHEQKKPFWRQTLEWIGIAPTEQLAIDQNTTERTEGGTIVARSFRSQSSDTDTTATSHSGRDIPPRAANS